MCMCFYLVIEVNDITEYSKDETDLLGWISFQEVPSEKFFFVIRL